MWHTHRYDEIERVYAPTVDFRGIKLSCEGNYMHALKTLFGLTTIIERCRECHQTRTVEVLGDARLTSPTRAVTTPAPGPVPEKS